MPGFAKLFIRSCVQVRSETVKAAKCKGRRCEKERWWDHCCVLSTMPLWCHQKFALI